MTSSEAAAIFAIFHGAYPHVALDDAISEVWMNSLLTNDADVARRAALEWVSTRKWWPTVVEFNAVIRAIRQNDVTDGPRQIHSGSRVMCDGTGWFDRGDGLEPCPSCNPWNVELFRGGDFQNLRQRPPDNWIQPLPCPPQHFESDLFEFDDARAAIERGYREHHAEIETDPAEVDARVAHLFSGGLRVGQPSGRGR